MFNNIDIDKLLKFIYICLFDIIKVLIKDSFFKFNFNYFLINSSKSSGQFKFVSSTQDILSI